MLRTLTDRRITKVFRRYPVVQVSTDLDAPARSVWEATKSSTILVHG